ncbi:leucine-rich repeat serine/threonine-protein kinase 2-like isoform X2 [Antedon mediterranea]|uniref:leucine-rich repeat serine/threonine-protein kinase 2-like isoform X2 n=1 Tax=Antedon mediterranea TaxID=105859 RepID=UPI003AF79A7C
MNLYCIFFYCFVSEIVEVACECLGILSCFKNEILNFACSENQLKAVEILVQLGANVNHGEENNLPINNAIQNHNVELVRFLLRQQVNDLQGCLKRSLSEEDHEITGLLLMHIGLDIKAGIVTWSGLQLGELYTQWFYDTFYSAIELAEDSGLSDTTEVDGGSAMAQRIITTKKNREQRQIRKTLLARTDGNLRSKVIPRGTQLRGAKFVEDSTDGGSRRSSSFGYLSSGDESFNDEIWFPGSNNSVEKRMRRASSATEYSFNTSSTRSLGRKPSVDSLMVPQSSNFSFQSIHRSYSNPFLPVNPDDPRLHLSKTSPDILCSQTSSSLDESSDSIRRTPYRRNSISSTSISPRSTGRSMSLTEKRSLFAKSSQEPLLECSIQEMVMPPTDDVCEVMPDIIVEFVTPTTSTPLQSERPRSRSLACMTATEKRAALDCKIHFLDLSSNGIPSLTPLIRAEQKLLRCFLCLHKLDLSNNSLVVFPLQLSSVLKNLKHLDLRNNRLKELPTHMFSCSKLETLDVSHNKIKDVRSQPDYSCFSLRELNLSNNSIDLFPAWLCNFVPALHVLNLACNNLAHLPDQPLYLPHLRLLKLCRNSLTELPNKFLLHTKMLETLHVSDNQLTTLPDDLGSFMNQLTTVKLARNNLATNVHPYIPRFLLKLPWVRSVDLSANHLSVLPEPSCWKSQSLRELLFADNSIRKLNLGDSIRSWQMLERLSLRNNELRQVPKELGQLTSLTTLDLSRNKELTTLPDELGKLNRLWELPLDGLRLDLPPAILRGRTKDIVTFLHQRLKRAVPYNRMKLMLVGYGGRGKTTLIRRLQREKISRNSNIATVGVNVREWTITVKHDRKPVDFLLSTWDFAGQEDFYSTHPCFLTGRALYLVVFDLSKGVSEINTIRPWLLTIQALAPSCPVILVGTHKDKVPKDQHQQILANINKHIREVCSTRGYPQIHEYVEVSNTAENESIEHLRRRIVKVIESLKIRGKPILGQMIPDSYLKLQQLVTRKAQLLREENKPPVLLAHQLNQMIKDKHILLDENELPQAVRFLHEIGVLLHYDDPAHHLSDLHFIEPEWLCKVMSRVVTVYEINPFINQQGILRKEKLRILLSGYELPGVTMKQYLRLFEKFDIMLPINDSDLLLPCKMPVKRPNITLPVGSRKGLLKRYYDMPYIPIGLWSRLILRLLLFTQDKVLQKDQICSLVVQSMNPDDSINVKKLMKNCEIRKEYWREGIYICWANNVFILVEPKEKAPDVLSVTVPDTKFGHKVLGLTCDLIDDLVEEWFPGLMEMDPVLGRPLLQKKVPCSCTGNEFVVDDLLEQLASLKDQVLCRTCATRPNIADLAPDLTLTDIEERFYLDRTQFHFKASSEFLLGDGGFGSVYKAVYKNKQVAVKVFNKQGDIHPHRMLRQEISVLRHLHHPSLISLEAVGINPQMLVMEFATSGSLSSIWKSAYRRLNRSQQHRIALQVAEGLTFLHDNKIVYRDLKPDNILIFSLNLGMMINAKIADYGISKFITYYGLKSNEGTPGYRAPEVIKGTATYNTEVDVYSFGILLYEIVTCGKKPFEDLDFRNELDDAVVKGRKLPPLTESGVDPWPELQDLIDLCLERVPENRPTSKETHRWLNTPELLCLQNTFTLFKDKTVECGISRVCSINQEEVVEVWFVGGDSNMSVICKVNLDQGDEIIVQGTACSASLGRALCMASAGEDAVLVGMHAHYICVYDAKQEVPQMKHTSACLTDSVLSLVWKPSHGDIGHVYAGLANGQFLIFNAEKLLKTPECQPVKSIKVGCEPIKCMTMTSSKLWLGCGGQPVSYELQPLEDEAYDDLPNTELKSDHLSLITCMCIEQKLWLARRQSAIIEVHDIKRRSSTPQDGFSGSKQIINLELLLTTEKKYVIVKSMVICSQVAWVGTSGGHMCLFDTVSLKLIQVVKRHIGPVTALILTEDQGYGKSDRVISAAMGYKSPFSNIHNDGLSFALVWDSEFKNHVRSLTTATEQRRKLIASGQRNWAIIRQATKLVYSNKTDKS